MLMAIFLQTISTMSVAYGSSSYYVIAFDRRGKEESSVKLLTETWTLNYFSRLF